MKEQPQTFDSIFPTIDQPEALPPIGSKVSYTVLKYSGSIHFKTRRSFLVLLHKDEQSMLISEESKARMMTFSEYSSIYTNPLMNCSVQLPVEQSETKPEPEEILDPFVEKPGDFDLFGNPVDPSL